MDIVNTLSLHESFLFVQPRWLNSRVIPLKEEAAMSSSTVIRESRIQLTSPLIEMTVYFDTSLQITQGSQYFKTSPEDRTIKPSAARSWNLPLTEEDRLVDVSNYILRRLPECGPQDINRLTFFVNNDEKAPPADDNLRIGEFLDGLKEFDARATISPKTLMLAVRVSCVNSHLGAVMCSPVAAPPLAVSPQVVDQLNALTAELEKLSYEACKYDRNARGGAMTKVAKTAETLLNGFENVQKAAGHAKDVFSHWEEAIKPVLSILEFVSDVGSTVPIIGILCSGAKKIISVVKAVGENDAALSQLQKSCDLLKRAIEFRVTVYFSPHSDVVVTDDLCISDFGRAMVNAAEVATDVLKFLLSKYRRRRGAIMGRLMDAVGGAEDLTEMEKQIDFAIKSIWVIEPVHYIFHLESASMYLTQPGALRFWKEHRYRYTVDSDEFVGAVLAFAASSISNFQAGDVRNKMMLRYSIDHNLDGLVHIREFESWLKGLDINEAVAAALNSKRSTDQPPESVPDEFLQLARVNMSEDLRFHLDDQSADSRNWLVELVRQRLEGDAKRPCLLLCADAGFGKSVISAKLVFENVGGLDGKSPIYFFFKLDDADSRTFTAMCDTLIYQIYSLVLKSVPIEAKEMIDKVRSLERSFQSNNDYEKWVDFLLQCASGYVSVIVIDALDECPPFERKKLILLLDVLNRKLMERLEKSMESPKIILTSRPASALLDANGKPNNFTSALAQLEKSALIDTLYLPELPEKSRRHDGLTPWEEKVMSVVRDGNTADLRDYLDRKFESITERETDLLVKRSNGNFLWLKIAVNIIQDNIKISPQSIKHVTLNFLSRSLSELYFRSFSNSVQSFDKFNKGDDGLKSLMSIILYAEEALTLEELFYIFSVNLNNQGSSTDSDGNEKRKTRRKEFDSIVVYPLYRLLIRVNSSQQVAAGHKSLRDSISKSSLRQLIDARDGHTRILQACFVRLLNLEKQENISGKIGSNRLFGPVVEKSDPERSKNQNVAKNYLSQYAAKFWYLHYQALLETRSSPDEGTLQKFAESVQSLLSTRQATYWIYLLCTLGALDVARTALRFVVQKLPSLTDKAVAWMGLVERHYGILAKKPEEIFRSVAAVGELHQAIRSCMDKDRDQPGVWVDFPLFWRWGVHAGSNEQPKQSRWKNESMEKSIEIFPTRHRDTALVVLNSTNLMRWDLNANTREELIPSKVANSLKDACLLEWTTEEENYLGVAITSKANPNSIDCRPLKKDFNEVEADGPVFALKSISLGHQTLLIAGLEDGSFNIWLLSSGNPVNRKNSESVKFHFPTQVNEAKSFGLQCASLKKAVVVAVLSEANGLTEKNFAKTSESREVCVSLTLLEETDGSLTESNREEMRIDGFQDFKLSAHGGELLLYGLKCVDSNSLIQRRSLDLNTKKWDGDPWTPVKFNCTKICHIGSEKAKDIISLTNLSPGGTKFSTFVDKDQDPSLSVIRRINEGQFETVVSVPITGGSSTFTFSLQDRTYLLHHDDNDDFTKIINLETKKWIKLQTLSKNGKLIMPDPNRIVAVLDGPSFQMWSIVDVILGQSEKNDSWHDLNDLEGEKLSALISRTFFEESTGVFTILDENNKCHKYTIGPASPPQVESIALDEIQWDEVPYAKFKHVRQLLFAKKPLEMIFDESFTYLLLDDGVIDEISFDLHSRIRLYQYNEKLLGPDSGLVSFGSTADGECCPVGNTVYAACFATTKKSCFLFAADYVEEKVSMVDMRNPRKLVAEMSMAEVASIQAMEMGDEILVLIASSLDIVIAVVRNGSFHRIDSFEKRDAETNVRLSKSKKTLVEELSKGQGSSLWVSKVESSFKVIKQTELENVEGWTIGERKGSDVIIYRQSNSIYMHQADGQTKLLITMPPSLFRNRDQFFLHEGKRLIWAADHILACILEIPDDF
ncbi:hypothetical protein DFJ73DRAFT_587077 [Zopfochytrium polystomum]|nr:hypothetical protein DFJ73DRAFT_587077 [Zopfochytrium polystomum]